MHKAAINSEPPQLNTAKTTGWARGARGGDDGVRIDAKLCIEVVWCLIDEVCFNGCVGAFRKCKNLILTAATEDADLGGQQLNGRGKGELKTGQSLAKATPAEPPPAMQMPSPSALAMEVGAKLLIARVTPPTVFRLSLIRYRSLRRLTLAGLR